MPKNPTDLRNPNSIEKRREKNLIERVNKEAAEDGRNLEREIARALYEESKSVGPAVEKMDADAKNAAKVALIQTAISKAKAAVSRAVTHRKKSYQRCLELVSAVEQARSEIEDDNIADGKFDKTVSDQSIADWLNGDGHNAAQGGEWDGKLVRDVLFRGPELIITHWVLECRTRMTAKALSADFSQPIDILSELERDYLERIADAIAISHRLNGHRRRDRTELLDEAQYLAKAVSDEQRNVGSLNMLARERLWKSFAEEDGSPLLDQDAAHWP